MEMILGLLDRMGSSAWAALNTNLGSGAAFFVLDALLVVVALPMVLNSRTRNHWRYAARNLAKNLLNIPKEVFEEGDWEFTIGFFEEIESGVAIMGSAIQAFSKLAAAMYEILPLILRVKRRMVILGRVDPNPEVNSRLEHQRAYLIDRELSELKDVVERHRQSLERYARL